MKNKKSRIIIITLGSIIALVGLVFFVLPILKPITTVTYTEIFRSELTKSLSLSGIVESVEKRNVYSDLGYRVKTVAVEVGDKVEAGDILCQLDTEELELNIALQKAELSVSQESSLNQLKESQRVYNEALSDLSEGTNIKIYSEQSNVNTLKLDFENKRLAYERNQALFEVGGVSKSEAEQVETAYLNAQSRYEDALISLKNAEEEAAKEIKRLKSNLDAAEIAANLDAKIISIELLEKKLADSTIDAPVSGTLTAVYAKEGSPGTGLLFVIEDTENLKIVTKIDEYDVGQVKAGAEAIIEIDSGSNNKYDGIVSMVSPAAIKDATGESVSSSVVEFEAEVLVLPGQSNLQIGMNADISITLEKRENIYFVPQKAVKTDKNGESVIFTVATSGANRGITKQIPISTGMKSDTYVEISGLELINGIIVIDDASLVENEMPVLLK